MGTGQGQEGRRQLLDHRISSYLEFSSLTYNATADDTNVVVTIVRTGEFREPVSVDYSTRDVTALAGADYQPARGTLQIPAGAGLGTLTVSLLPNDLRDRTTTLEVVLENPSPNGQILTGTAVLALPATRAVPLAVALALSVHTGPANQVVIAWPSDFAKAVLQKTTDPEREDWMDVVATQVLRGERYQVTQPASEGRFFYRLRVQN